MKKTLLFSALVVSMAVGLAGCFGKCGDKACSGEQTGSKEVPTETNVDARDVAVADAATEAAPVDAARTEAAPAEEVK